jgi:hypothetical protein
VYTHTDGVDLRRGEFVHSPSVCGVAFRVAGNSQYCSSRQTRVESSGKASGKGEINRNATLKLIVDPYPLMMPRFRPRVCPRSVPVITSM